MHNAGNNHPSMPTWHIKTSAFYLYPAFVSLGMSDFDAPSPAMRDLFVTFVKAHIFNDFAFYFTHRLAHTPWIYQRIHKKHHMFAGTIGFAAEYCHPIGE